MLNIFNLSLLLFLFWVLFIFGHSAPLSGLYIFGGLILSFVISIISLRARMFNKNSEMIFFSMGFYRHFAMLFLRNFLSSVSLLCDIAISHRRISPVVVRLSSKNNQDNSSKALLVSSLNMTTGIICVGFSQEFAMVHAVNHEYLRVNEIKKIRKSLREINDHEL